jgi:hypothetical protein
MSSSNLAFDVVFGIFVVLVLGLAVIAVRWAVLRDRLARSSRAEPESTEGHESTEQHESGDELQADHGERGERGERGEGHEIARTEEK